MDSPKGTALESSPLDRIRQAEAEVTRQLAAARKAAEATLEDARSQAAQLKRKASENGRLDGETQCRDTIAQAQREASAIVAQAQKREEGLRQQAEVRMEAAVSFAVAVVMGQQTEKGGT
jgi:vacuolar-type H+-ATPase subunit H